jgi:DNA-binding MarR family transcriptional regulator/GNAT superfamily N-acetyltransferase
MSQPTAPQAPAAPSAGTAPGAGTAPAAAGPAAEVRAFNRFYTNAIGLLHGKYLDTPYSLTEGRLLFELGQGTPVSELRRLLDIDAGYLSRILSRFEADGLVTRQRSKDDARRQLITLTEAGQATRNLLDARSAEQMSGLLASLGDEDTARLLDAMRVITVVLSAAPRQRAVVLRPPEPGDMGWVVQQHGARYAEEYGWDATFEALVARIVADFVEHGEPATDAAWIAEVDGQRAGCVFCVRDDENTARLRLLLVEPWARGLGIGSRLVDEVLRFARRAGYKQVTLWTNDVLVSARKIYQAAGFTLVSEEPHRAFGKDDLVSQDWSLTL